MEEIKDYRAEIKFDITPQHFATLYPYGEAVELWGMRMPEYESGYIKGKIFGGFSEGKVDRELNDWSQWGHMEEDQQLNQDTGNRYTVYRLKDNPETHALVKNVYGWVDGVYEGNLLRSIEEYDEEDLEAFMDF